MRSHSIKVITAVLDRKGIKHADQLLIPNKRRRSEINENGESEAVTEREKCPLTMTLLLITRSVQRYLTYQKRASSKKAIGKKPLLSLRLRVYYL